MAVAESQGIESDLLPKIATGFCSGLARTGGLCGALSGGIMALNLMTGRSKPGAPVDRNYMLVRELIDQYETRFGSTICKELTGVDLGTEDGRIEFQAKNQIFSCLDQAEAITRMVLELAERED